MLDYTNYNKPIKPLQKRGLENTFYQHFKNSLEGFDVVVDGEHELKALIQKHSNPINSHLEDKYFTVLEKDGDCVKWGSYIEGYEGKKYIVLTYPETTDGVTKKAKIRKITETCKFTLEDGSQFTYDCIDTNYLIYDDKTYTTDTKVFEDDERRAIVVPYTFYTSLLRVIDEVEIKGVKYKIIKTEFLTEEDYEGNKEGVVQLVLIRTTFGSLYCNDYPLRALVRFARMKDKVLNSKSRELITDHNQVKSGDYIKHSYVRDNEGNIETRYYIVRSLVDMRLDYDVTYIINCDSEFYMWDDNNKEPIMIPCYVEDNKTRFEDENKSNLILEASQFQIIVQENEFTKKLGKEVDRIIIKGEAYTIVGTDNISLENAIYVGLANSIIDPNKDNLELGIADFDNQVGEDIIEETDPIQIYGEDECIIGEEYEYVLINSSEDCIWSLDNYDLGLIRRNDINSAIVTISSKVKDIGKKLTITCEEKGIVYTKEIVIRGW